MAPHSVCVISDSSKLVPSSSPRLTPAALLIYLLPNNNLRDSPRASSAPSFTSNINIHLLLFMPNTFHIANICKFLTQTTLSRGGSHELLLCGPNRLLGSFTGWRSMLHQTGFVVTREAYFPSEKGCFYPAGKLKVFTLKLFLDTQTN